VPLLEQIIHHSGLFWKYLLSFGGMKMFFKIFASAFCLSYAMIKSGFKWCLIGSIAFVIGSLGGLFVLTAQTQFSIHYSLQNDERFDALGIDPPVSAVDTLQAAKILSDFVNGLRADSYLEAAIDSSSVNDSIINIYLHIGPTYQWLELDVSEVDPLVLKQQGYRASDFVGNKLDFTVLQLFFDGILSYYEERGYPFAEAWLDQPIINDGEVRTKVRVKQNRRITIKEVVNAGDANISNVYLQRYLGLYPSRPFQKSRIADDAPRRLNELPFATQRRDPLIQFKEDEAVINVFLNKRNASRFDFVLGVLPNSRETGRLLFTGTANMDLYNPFGAGERLFFLFQRLRPETQELKAEINYPYLLDLPFGLDAKFNLYTRDSTNRDISFDIGILYMLPGGDFFRGFWSQFNSDILSVNEAIIINSKSLPRVLDVRNALYGVEVLRQKLDYRFNPRKGWRLHAKAATGTRRILENSTITGLNDPNNPEFDFGTLYDNLQLRGFQIRANANISYFQPLSKFTTLLFNLKSGYMYTPGDILRNEAFRIGGNQLLRGFDEESIFSSHYHVFSLEYRLITGQNSNLFLFGDAAFIEDNTGEVQLQDWPYGFGAGLNFETPVGIFGLTGAVGAQRGNPLDFRAVRIHFGYVSLF